MIIAATGHRPSYCPCKYDENHKWFKSLRRKLLADLEVGWEFTQLQYVISGMALGWDIWFAEAALEIGIPLHCYLPFKGQENKWPTKTQKRYGDILSKATNVITISPSFSKGAYLKRDREMINNADLVFALYDPHVDSGGTEYTVKYAVSKNKPVYNYWFTNAK